MEESNARGILSLQSWSGTLLSKQNKEGRRNKYEGGNGSHEIYN